MDRKIILNRMRNNPFFMTGMITAFILVVLLLLAPVITRYDPIANNLREAKLAPEYFARGIDGHVLGTDQLGRDIYTRVLYGGRASLLLAVIVTSCQIVMGSVLGIMAGYFGGWVDAFIMRMCEVFMSIPNLILAIAVVSIFGASMLNLVIVLTLTGWIRCAKITRNAVKMIRHQEFVHASKAIGCSGGFIMFRQILPNVTTQIIIQASQRIGLCILTEASLSFLGLGIQPPDASWGNMISVGRQYLTTHPWMCFAPGIALMITCMAFNFLGDGLRDVLDPKRTSVKVKKKDAKKAVKGGAVNG